MISASIRRSLIYLHPRKTSFLGEFHGPFSLSIQFRHICSESECQPVAIPTSSEFLLGGVSTERSKSLLFFLKENGFSETQLEKLMKSRKQLCSDLDKSIKPKFKIFQDWGFSESEIVAIFTKRPTILCYSGSKKIISSLSFLKDLLGSKENMMKALKRWGWFFTTDVQKNAWPNVEFLRSSGIPMEHVCSILVTKFPSSIFQRSDIVREHVKKLNTLGMDPSSKTFVYALRILCVMPNELWEFKMKTFRDLGFSESDILTIFRRAPHVFGGSVTKIKRMVEVILATNRYNVSSIVSHPILLSCSIDKRIMPRLQILESLYKKNLIKEWPCLAPVYHYSDERFYRRYTALLSK